MPLKLRIQGHEVLEAPKLNGGSPLEVSFSYWEINRYLILKILEKLVISSILADLCHLDNVHF